MADHLVQPRLVTHPSCADLGDLSDVVTCRLVTRDVGKGPEVFSRCLEVRYHRPRRRAERQPPADSSTYSCG